MRRSFSTIANLQNKKEGEEIRNEFTNTDCEVPADGDTHSTLSSRPVSMGRNDDDDYSDDENEMNIAAPVSTSSETRTILKSMLSYLDAHSNDKMNNKMDVIEIFVDNLMLENNEK
ncbi:hypothetical protein TNCV_16491 [Trichonephila clavipes]|nr:hypothetical protein TNCV_16491 [Trichonephila clavipes]